MSHQGEQTAPVILVVEDDRDCREMLSTWLQGHGYATVQATNGLEAMERLEQDPRIELILLDLMMPGMSGWQFRTSQRGVARFRKIPVVVMTAHPNPAGEAEWLDAEGVLLKPLDLSVVLDVVNRCFGHAGPAAGGTARVTSVSSGLRQDQGNT